MKKIIAVLLCAALFASFFAACKKENNTQTSDIILKPTQKVNTASLKPEADFLGTYANEAYTVEVTKAEDGQLHISIRENAKTADISWEMDGWFSKETCRVNYTDAVKVENGETKYDYGTGRLQFSENGTLIWDNYTEQLSGSTEMQKQK